MSLSKKQYETTARAGAWVAGRRKPAGGRLMLTDAEAAFELAQGAIVLSATPAARGRGKRSK